MAVTIPRDDMLARAAEEGARRLLRAAAFFVEQHQRRLSVSNPRPYLDSSKEGEYPRMRSGVGKAGVLYGPTTVQDIVKGGMKVRIGQLVNTAYMLILELRKARLGFRRTAKDTRDVIELILGTKAK